MSGVTEFFQQLLVGVGIAGITSLVTVRLSLRQFRSERWWERQAQAYSEVLEALSEMRAYFDKQYWLATLGEGATLPKEQMMELWARYAKGHDHIEKSVAIGEFVMSSDAVTALHPLLQDPVEVVAMHSVDDFSAQLAVIDECSARIRQCGKKDLGVRGDGLRTWWMSLRNRNIRC